MKNKVVVYSRISSEAQENEPTLIEQITMTVARFHSYDLSEYIKRGIRTKKQKERLLKDNPTK